MHKRFASPSLCFGLLTVFLFVSFANAQQKLLTIDDIYDAQKRVNFSGSLPALRWLPDGESYVQTRLNTATRQVEIQKVNARTGQVTPYADSQRIAAAFAKVANVTGEQAEHFARGTNWEYNKANNAFFIQDANQLYLYDFNSNEARRLLAAADKNSFGEFVAAWSPDGNRIAFTRNNNLFVLNPQTNETKQLTTDGTAKIFNGVLNWVYQEELYGRGNFKAFWWSPDSKQLAFLRLDDAPVSEFAVVDHIPKLQEVETTPYPKAGEPNPLVSLHVVGADGGGGVRTIDNSAYAPQDFLISRVEWTPDGKVIYQAQDREQHFLDLNAVDAAGRPTRLFREGQAPASNQTSTSNQAATSNQTSAPAASTTPASAGVRPWVEVIDNPLYLKDNSFLWLSDRTGYRHLYHYDKDGKLIKQLTNGAWEIRDLHGADERTNQVYFTATAHSSIAPQVYRVRLDGSALTRLSQQEGSHTASFNSNYTYFTSIWSDINTPAKAALFSSNGEMVRMIENNPAPRLAEYKLGKPEFMTVKTRDGFEMNAMMIRPPDFDATKKYPVWSYTYSGPQAPSVRNAWGGATYLWHQMLAQRGYIIWICDNRSASGKGVAPTWTANRNFGEGELRDLLDGVSYLKSLPYVDASRIGLWGWSYGGFMTSYALTHSDAFKIGVAGGSVTDWKLYDSIYTERYMGTPQTNPEGYRRSSVIEAAPNLKGKLMLVHGTIDDNVHMQNTIQLAYALQKAGKQFELMLYPKSRHGVVDPQLVKHMRQMMTDFIIANL